ncbi:hypothetical protein Taro_026473 [Colocasia esculenta]|uniref:Uncharacterized protein n=1 Tax=Colocasia esculenta TaxID=4460 RepID=A0A843VKP0_COLES|nr:hypothetical protein [Colocasia esculenta]
MGASSTTCCWRLALPAALLLLLCTAIGGAVADAMVTGAVFCDQCRDGQRSLFDYPLCGAKVAVACAGGDGQVVVYKEGTTNWFGTYGLRFEGIDDLSRCYAQVVGGPEGCGAGAGPARGLNLLFRMFGMEMYTVDALLALPPQAMFFCPKPSPFPAPPAGPDAGVVHHPPTPPEAPRALPPPRSTPPVEGSRPPSLPFLQASACPYEKWAMQEFRCYWTVVGPDTTVALAFGPLAARKYGTDMTLMQGLQGRGDLYRTLLREATAALLNSYNSLLFFYPTLSVIDRMNSALLGPPRQALMVALRFRRANSGAAGYGDARCTFAPCN